MHRNRLATIFVIVFIDLLGFSLILPLLPFYAEAYSATPALVGLLVASYAAAQLIGAPLLGRLSDRYGRRPILLVSVFGTAMGFLLLGLAEPLGIFLTGLMPAALVTENVGTFQNHLILGLLFLSRIVDGLTGGNISVAQAYITDITDEQNRAKGLGLIGAAFGLGFIIGPAVGGILSRWGYAVPAFVAAGIAFLNLIAIFIWLPESLSAQQRAGISRHTRSVLSLKALGPALSRPRLGPLLYIRFFFALAFGTFESVFVLYAQYRLGLTAETTGYILTYVGILIVIVQGGGIGWLTARYSEPQLTLSAVTLMTVSLLAWAFVPNVTMLLVVLVPLALAGGTFNAIINSLISKSVYAEEVGGVLGLSASLESLTRVIGPSVGGLLLGQLGTWAPGVFGAILVAWLIPFTWRRLIASPVPPLPSRTNEPHPAGPAG